MGDIESTDRGINAVRGAFFDPEDDPPEELMGSSRMILNAIPLGYESPKRLSRHLKIDEESIEGEIGALISNGYVRDPGDPRVGFLSRIKLGFMIDTFEFLTTRKFLHELVLTEKGYDNVEEETIQKIRLRLSINEGPFERIWGWIVCLIAEILRPIAWAGMLLLDLLRVALELVRDIPLIITWVMNLVLSCWR
jgi:hypothetical protein